MKNPNNFKVIRNDGRVYDLAEFGVIVNSFVPESPNPVHKREMIDGVDGFVDLGTNYDGRIIRSVITIISVDNNDYPLLRNEMFRLFDSRESFYIISDEEPGKRYKVKYNSPFSLSRLFSTGQFNIEFISPSTYAESIGTTQDEFNFENELWQIGQGLIESDDLIYTHSSTVFRIYNAGDKTVDPRELPLVIEYKGTSTNLEINNTTTGDIWSYTGSSIVEDVIKLDGVRSTKNDQSIFGATNRKLIRLAPGWNDFTLNGTGEGFEIKFDFRFYYL